MIVWDIVALALQLFQHGPMPAAENGELACGGNHVWQNESDKSVEVGFALTNNCSQGVAQVGIKGGTDGDEILEAPKGAAVNGRRTIKPGGAVGLVCGLKEEAEKPAPEPELPQDATNGACPVAGEGCPFIFTIVE